MSAVAGVLISLVTSIGRRCRRTCARPSGSSGRTVPCWPGKQTADLVSQLRPQLEQVLQTAAASSSLPSATARRRGFRRAPEAVRARVARLPPQGFPALVDEGDAVRARVFSDEASQLAPWPVPHGAGAAQPARPPPACRPPRAPDRQPHETGLGALRNRPYASGRDVAEDVLAAAMDQAIAAHGDRPGPAGFEALVAAVRADVEPAARKGVIAAGASFPSFKSWAGVRRRCGPRPPPDIGTGSADGPGGRRAPPGAPGGARFVSRAGLGACPISSGTSTGPSAASTSSLSAPADLATAQSVQALQRRLDEAMISARQEAGPWPAWSPLKTRGG